MENASKALIIAAGILIAIGLIGLATRLFSSASEVSKTYHSKQESDEINTFNSNFTKYMGAIVDEASGTEQKYATIYDVISVANFAWNYNTKMVDNPINIAHNGAEAQRILHVNLRDSNINASKGCTDLQNMTQETYYSLMQNCYYKSNYQNDDNIMNFEIRIDRTNGDGRINEVTFYPEQRIDAFNDTINNNINYTQKVY